jgi:uncharacterized protein
VVLFAFQPICENAGIMRALAFPFTIANNRNVGETSVYEEIVRGQVIDALMTNQGERAFRADYGCDIQAALFDPSSELARADAGQYILQRLQRYVPRAVVVSVEVQTPDETPNVVYINIIYRPSVFQGNQTLRVPISSEFLSRNLGGQ